jgi:Icc-related predicted phosphoesterase
MHNKLEIPDGDIFIFAGDISDREKILINFNHLLGELPHNHKIIIDGNHDLPPEKVSELITNATYLQHGLLEIENIRIWGTSWQYWLLDQIKRKKNQNNLQGIWELIPTGVDILITHFPPFGIGDLTTRKKHLGSKDLLTAISRIKPKYHIFGHIHESYGVYKEKTDDYEITFINSSAVMGFGSEFNPPIVFTI